MVSINDTQMVCFGERHRSIRRNVYSVDVLLPDGSVKTVVLNEIAEISAPIRVSPLESCAALNSLQLTQPRVASPQFVKLDILIGKAKFSCLLLVVALLH